MGQCRSAVGRDHGSRSAYLARPRRRRHLLLWRGVESGWNVSGQWELSAGGAGVGGDQWAALAGLERAQRDRVLAGLESDRSGAAQWWQRWEHALVGRAERGEPGA